MMKSFFVIAALLMVQPAFAGDLYRWVDKQGKVHYGDTPVEDADELNLKRYGEPSASAVEEASLPYETRQAKEHFPVTLYVTKSCTSYCKEARNFLSKRKVPYTEKSIDTQEEFDKFKKQSGMESFPSLSVGKNWLQGFSDSSWTSELDAAGYPK